MLITPQMFWDRYREAYRRNFCGSAYRRNALATKRADTVARQVIQDVGLQPQREYYLIDWIGYEPTPKGQQHNWRLRAALEHENDSETWSDEFCKLTNIAADLCVVISYWDYKRHNKRKQTLAATLQERTDRLADRIRLVPSRRWLFIFGPRSNCPDQPFAAFTLDDELQVTRLQDDSPLRPCDWSDWSNQA